MISYDEMGSKYNVYQKRPGIEISQVKIECLDVFGMI
jgi:hypothetical protein